MPFLMSADAFARRAVQAILRRRSLRTIPWQMAWVSAFLRLMPNWLYDRAFVAAPRKARNPSLGARPMVVDRQGIEAPDGRSSGRRAWRGRLPYRKRMERGRAGAAVSWSHGARRMRQHAGRQRLRRAAAARPPPRGRPAAPSSSAPRAGEATTSTMGRETSAPDGPGRARRIAGAGTAGRTAERARQPSVPGDGQRLPADDPARTIPAAGSRLLVRRRFHGLPTSIGERYDMYAMTAAHPTLPIPSLPGSPTSRTAGASSYGSTTVDLSCTGERSTFLPRGSQARLCRARQRPGRGRTARSSRAGGGGTSFGFSAAGRAAPAALPAARRLRRPHQRRGCIGASASATRLVAGADPGRFPRKPVSRSGRALSRAGTGGPRRQRGRSANRPAAAAGARPCRLITVPRLAASAPCRAIGHRPLVQVVGRIAADPRGEPGGLPGRHALREHRHRADAGLGNLAQFQSTARPAGRVPARTPAARIRRADGWGPPSATPAMRRRWCGRSARTAWSARVPARGRVAARAQ